MSSQQQKGTEFYLNKVKTKQEIYLEIIRDFSNETDTEKRDNEYAKRCFELWNDKYRSIYSKRTRLNKIKPDNH